MSRKSSERSLMDYGWMPGVLLAVIAAVYWWLRVRSNRRQPAEQPVIWRRDIEMGPSAPESGSAEAEEVVEEVTIEAIPDVRAGDGGLSDEGTVEVESEQTAVEGPIPTAEKGSAVETPAGDDLEIVEGIGPKINSILQAAGIRTFAQLAAADVAQLEEILRAAGMRRINNPATWPEQARLAAGGDWNGLETLQKSLKAGRRA